MTDPITHLNTLQESSCRADRGLGEGGIDRRVFLRRAISGLIGGGFVLPSGAMGYELARDWVGRTPGREPHPPRVLPRLEMPATLQVEAFASASGDDRSYHALVYEEGSAAEKALLTTPLSDREIARRLRDMGAEDGGGVPMAAWNLRRLPLVRAPRTRVAGTPLRILVDWEGWDAPREISSLLQDPGGRGLGFRFGGNEEHDHLWESGCIACLFSCPGGVVSNERYSIRDYVRGTTSFSPATDLPVDEVPVTVILELPG